MRRRIFLSYLMIGCLSPFSIGPTSKGSLPSVPQFSHVIVIVMENKEFADVIGNAKAPNFNGWAKQYTLLTNFYAITHPSLPNYLAMIAGDTFGIQEDCTDCFFNAKTLPDVLESAGRSWKTYQESLPTAGFTGKSRGQYVIRHNPFLYFNAIRNDEGRRQRGVVPLTQLEADLNRDRFPDFAFIIPNLCHSSHDCGIEATDKWLGPVVKTILQSPIFDQNALLVLTFDEGMTNLGGANAPPGAKGGRIATVLISSLVKTDYRDPTPYSHYSLLKTISAAWGLESLGHAADPDTNLLLLPWGKNETPKM